MLYDNAHDAYLYLNGSLVKYKGDLVLVKSVDDTEKGIEVLFVYAKNEEAGTALLSELDLSAISLGYVNVEAPYGCLFLYRKPMRHWRQGLTNENVRAKNLNAFRIFNYNLPALAKMLSGKYLSIEEASKLAKEERKEVPFHRLFSIDRYGIIRYKTQVIGDWCNYSLNIMSSFSYLKELLLESTGGTK